MSRTLKQYADEQHIKYRAAWNRYREGKLPGAYKNETGKIIVPYGAEKPDYTICYARVSSSQNKSNLDSQAARLASYCAANGWAVQEIVKECASGLNDERPKLLKILRNTDVTRLVVEHKDRLTRFGFNYIKVLLDYKGCTVVIINEAANDKEDLMQDFVSLVTSFVARLYGLRRSKRRTEEIITRLQNED